MACEKILDRKRFYSTRDETVRFTYVPSVLVEGKQTKYITNIRTETVSCKFLSPVNVYSIDSIVYAYLPATPSNP